MAASRTTTKLGLSLWAETDKPTRTDFVSDNQIIENSLGGHVDNSDIHVTQDEKTRISQPYFFKTFQGTDGATRTVTFDFEPSFVLVFALDKAPCEFDSGSTTVNYGFAVKNVGGSMGCSLSGNRLSLMQNVSGNVNCNLNNSSYQYSIIAFR